MAKRKPKTISDTLRTAILASGQSLYAVSQASGISYAQVHRFVAGERGLAIEAIDQLATYLGLVLTKPKSKRR